MNLATEPITRTIHIEVVDGLAGLGQATPVIERGDLVSYLADGSTIPRDWYVSWIGPDKYKDGNTRVGLRQGFRMKPFFVDLDRITLVRKGKQSFASKPKATRRRKAA